MLTSHVVSHSLALALRDAGYPQSDSLFIWTRAWTRKGGTLRKDGKWYITYNQYHGEGNLAAPLASELMERMEGRLQHRFLLTIQKPDPDAYSAAYDDTVNAESLAYNCEKTLPDALAKSWLHLRKASLI